MKLAFWFITNYCLAALLHHTAYRASGCSAAAGASFATMHEQKPPGFMSTRTVWNLSACWHVKLDFYLVYRSWALLAQWCVLESSTSPVGGRTWSCRGEKRWIQPTDASRMFWNWCIVCIILSWLLKFLYECSNYCRWSISNIITKSLIASFLRPDVGLKTPPPSFQAVIHRKTLAKNFPSQNMLRRQVQI